MQKVLLKVRLQTVSTIRGTSNQLFYVTDSLRGVRYRNETQHDALSYVSMAGGMEIFIDGSGMDEMPALNTVMFAPDSNPSQMLPGPAQDSK